MAESIAALAKLRQRKKLIWRENHGVAPGSVLISIPNAMTGFLIGNRPK
jgi:hypothetical protein